MLLTAAVECLFGFNAVANTALGYIDPGTSNVLIPAAVGSVGAAVLFVKHYWRKIVRLARRDHDDQHEIADESAEQEPSSP